MTPPEVDRIAPPARDPSGLPHAASLAGEEGDAAGGEGADDLRSLAEDVEALIDDGKTYLRTELIYQKTRAAFVADRAKSAFVYGAVAAVLGFLALIGLTVGLIIALTPWLSAWGATALVVLLLIGGALVALGAAGKKWKGLMGAIQNEPGAGKREPRS